MNITMNLFTVLGIILSSAAAGFGIGRYEKRPHQKEGEKVIVQGKIVGSPVSGEVREGSESGMPEAVILPDEGVVYAPASGKIVRLFPMGNAFVLEMEDQIQISIRVGGYPDELNGQYFRPRIIQNEIVNKGKELLVFDREGLTAAGESADVAVRVENCPPEKTVESVSQGHIRVGEELMKVY